MTNPLEQFRLEFLGANSWAQRKEGVPLYLLDNLSAQEMLVAEKELLKAIDTGDSWPIIGLGHLQTKAALPKLYTVLGQSEKKIKIIIAHSIYQINEDPTMIDIVLEEMPKTVNWIDLIDVFYMLPDFKNEKVTQVLDSYREHHDYLVAYNATRALGLPTEEVVEKFRGRKIENHITPITPTLPKGKRSWWQKMLGI